MRFSSCVFGILSLTSLTTPARCEEMAPRPIEEADSVLAIYPEDWGLGSPARVPALILAVWPDGHIVWSKDRLSGGAPYFAGQVDRKIVNSLMSRLEQDGVFADKSLNKGHFGPEAAFTTLLVRSGKNELRMQSWHEVSEADGGEVAGSHGVSGLAGKRRFEALRKEQAEYLYYRLVWSETRGRLIDLIPNEGKRVSGKIVTINRGVSWVETPAGGGLRQTRRNSCRDSPDRFCPCVHKWSEVTAQVRHSLPRLPPVRMPGMRRRPRFRLGLRLVLAGTLGELDRNRTGRHRGGSLHSRRHDYPVREEQMTDRKKPTAGFWITVALVAVLVGYLLSSGPALYVIMKLGKPGWLATAADFFYAPLVWALGLSPNWLADSYWNYTFCWDSLAH